MKDRRVRKTEQAIQAAFAKLLSEKSMENITVKHLCETADINKSTFYLHYKDIYDCADCLRDAIVDELSAVFAPYNFAEIIANFSLILETIMDIFEKNRELYMPYLKSPSLSSSLCKIKQLILEKVLARVDDNDRSNEICRCTVSFVISGIIGVLEQHEFAEIKQQAILALADKVQNGFACHQ
ncbi:TetR/AcrR family transcriptional regulator [Desulfosporosinus sp. PR]|uniref:TetR/AcrR family transcriptional regulator n=1 Tax=Candidatus Desulfosporosinus nitrosoreducens TaxID=3401928 RepID=UPI0027F0A4B5|nr:TetR/AcrR family transcriptional regulator [Desulfosporosinus sp. PR]MDQ7094675.1 TetR/AcrR family transcriptional regulator [Desulfosporosinus sp. PR]